VRSDLSSVEIEIVGVADTLLNVLQATDVKASSVNDLLTPSSNL